MAEQCYRCGEELGDSPYELLENPRGMNEIFDLCDKCEEDFHIWVGKAKG